MIRIISGTHKGRRIQAPKNLPVRPTTDRSKESLFNILNNRVNWKECKALDLFSGTGNISFECASRGCPTIIAVDVHAACVKFIQSTADNLEMPIQAIKQDALIYLNRSKQPFDIIFCDPPYAYSQNQLETLVEKIMEPPHLNEDGILIVEHIKHIDLSGLKGFQEARRYGQSIFSFFIKNP